MNISIYLTKKYEKVLAVMDEHMGPDSHNIGHRAYTIANNITTRKMII